MSVNRTVALTRSPRAEPVCLRLSEVAAMVDGTRIGDVDPMILGLAGLDQAGSSDLTFLARPGLRRKLNATRAAAVLVNHEEAISIPAIRVDDPALAFTIVLRYFADAAQPICARGIHPTASVDDSARLGTDVTIGANVVIEDGVEIGDRTIVLPGTVILRDAIVGSDCLIHANVTIRDSVRLGDRVVVHCGAVLGSDGFGYVQNGKILHKVPHIGSVEVGDDVEIGANTCVDRGTTGVTRIGRGTKIDNLVMLAHGVRLGEHCLLAGQAGIAGSTQIGSRVTFFAYEFAK